MTETRTNRHGQEPKKTFEVTERATLRMAESVMSNYREPSLALLDLVDNAVDNRIENEQLTINVRVSKNEISIQNRGGSGLDLEGLQNFLYWGHSDKSIHQIGQYGVGGKAAMGFLGRDVEVRCSAKDSDREYRLHIPDWQSKGEVVETVHTGTEEKSMSNDGYFMVTIKDLQRERQIKSDSVSTKLGDIYKPLIETGEIRIFVNGKLVPPLELIYSEEDPNFRAQRMEIGTGFGDKARIKVGISENRNVKPGFRLYYRGRLIEDGVFFGIPQPSQ